jgi:hypothetical protein
MYTIQILWFLTWPAVILFTYYMIRLALGKIDKKQNKK